MRKILLLPYPVNFTTKNLWKICLVFSMFVFLFLFVFRPFGLYEVQNNFFSVVAGYALICFVVMAVLNIGMRKVFPNFFSGKSWTIGKELFWILVNIMFIGIANTIYSSYLNFFPLNILTFLRFIFYVLVIGLFPVTIFTFIRQSVLQKKFIKESNVINEIINIPLHVPQQYEASIISIPSQNVNEHFSVTVSEILFIRSADNYVEIFYMEKDKVNRKLIRNLMKQVESNLRAYPQFFRCHKSFLINLEKVSHVSGNAQGLKLTLKGIEELIPVSRNLTKIVRKKIAAYH